ncbi:MAG: hypothetical protein ACYTEQ_27355 [Planctomycetota bacterium]|jgi:uncharacterized protein HemX
MTPAIDCLLYGLVIGLGLGFFAGWRAKGFDAQAKLDAQTDETQDHETERHQAAVRYGERIGK